MKKKIKNILKYISIPIIATLMFFITLSAQADTIDYELLTSNYNTTLYLQTTNVVDTQSNLSFKNIENFNMIDTKYPSASSTTTTLNHEVITYTTTKTINANMALYMKYNNATTRINFNLNNETQLTFLTTETPTTINGNLNIYKFTQQIEFNAIEIFNSYIGTPNENSFYFTILNANERAYNQGYNDAMQEYNTLQNQYNNLQNQYNNLQQQYNDLATNEYTFENLFWSVGSVPMAFLMQSFNVDVLGINIAAIITGLITAIIVIWIIKKIIK